jgi:hypothetical protein
LYGYELTEQASDQEWKSVGPALDAALHSFTVTGT